MYSEEIPYESWDRIINEWQNKPDHMPCLVVFVSLLGSSISWHVKLANHIRNKGFKVTLDDKSYGIGRKITIEEKQNI